MGACCSAPPVSEAYRPGQPIRILILGLDNAGATTLLYRLKMNKMIVTVPTLGAVEETIGWGGDEITFHDLGGTDKLRPLWPMYQEGMHGVIYVVDAADRASVSTSRQELRRFFRAATELHNAPLLVLANKQDVEGALSPEQVRRELALDDLSCRTAQVAACSAVTGRGLREGIDWIVREIKNPSPSPRRSFTNFPGRASITRLVRAAGPSSNRV
ncbi:hypothetical protein CDCA_CDCA02G0813 [Cyanidium caldarium]|uniref:Uncharacterized protein n=1 Tax=Cyanidium caldarium TaxID=2771 RepID=A0AAV9IRW4_CYACA|nr:hypothetical protein CDCA_CDCA02G0813 [Cyanidium caldarium]